MFAGSALWPRGMPQPTMAAWHASANFGNGKASPNHWHVPCRCKIGPLGMLQQIKAKLHALLLYFCMACLSKLRCRYIPQPDAAAGHASDNCGRMGCLGQSWPRSMTQPVWRTIWLSSSMYFVSIALNKVLG